MNDSRNIEDGASASLCAYIRIFTTTTSNKQYFLNEKAVYSMKNNPYNKRNKNLYICIVQLKK